MDKIEEASVVVYASKQNIVDKKMEIFYNPIMKSNRDISILLLKALGMQGMKIADPLAGSGIRSLRMLKELPDEMMSEIFINDKNPDYEKYMEKNIEENKIEGKIKIFNSDASIFLIENRPFDYVDIDPFGTPNPFLDSACRALKANAILAVTATDTSALCGTYPKACRRKYWAEPLRNELMHEIGLRILIRKVQLMGLNHQRALFPILSYSADHYMRIFFVFRKGKKEMDKVIGMHDFYEGKYGPIYNGELNDEKLIEKMIVFGKEKEYYDEKTLKLLKTLLEETKIGGIGFFDVHKMSRKFKGKDIPKFKRIFEALKEKGFMVSRTHFSDTAIKTNAKSEEFEKIYKKLIQ